MCWCVSSAGKPRQTYIRRQLGRETGKWLQSGEDNNKNQAHRLFQPIAPLCRAAHSSIPNAYPCWRSQIQFGSSQQLSPSFCHMKQSPCMATHHQHPGSGQQQVPSCLLKPWFLSQPICSESPRRVSNSTTMSLGGRTVQIKEFGSQSIIFNQRRSAPDRAGLLCSPGRLPALVLVITVQGSPPVTFSDSAENMVQIFLCAESQPVPHLLSRSCV